MRWSRWSPDVSAVSGPHLCQHQPPPWTVTAPEVPKCVWVPRRLGAPWDHIQTAFQRRIENYYMTSSSKILRSKEGTAKLPSAVTQYSFLILLSTASSLTSSSSSSNNPIFHQFSPCLFHLRGTPSEEDGLRHYRGHMAGGSQGHGIHQPRPSLRHGWEEQWLAFAAMNLLKKNGQNWRFHGLLFACCLHCFTSRLVKKSNSLADCCSVSLAEGDLASLHPCNSVECTWHFW